MSNDLYAQKIRLVSGSMEYTISAVDTVDPNGSVTEPSGSIIRSQDGKVWVNTDGGTTWTDVSGLSGSTDAAIKALSGTVDARFLNVTGSLISGLASTYSSLQAGVTASVGSAYTVLQSGITGSTAGIYDTILAGTSASDAAVQVSLKAGATASLNAAYGSLQAGSTASIAALSSTLDAHHKNWNYSNIGVTGSVTITGDLRVTGSITGSGNATVRGISVSSGNGSAGGYKIDGNDTLYRGTSDGHLYLFNPYSVGGAGSYDVVIRPISTEGDIRLQAGGGGDDLRIYDDGTVKVFDDLEVVGSVTGSGQLRFVGSTSHTHSLHGEVQIVGPERTTHFNYNASTNRNTYIRAGMTSGTIYVGDVNKGNVRLGAADNPVLVQGNAQVQGSLTGSGDATFSQRLGIGATPSMARLEVRGTGSSTSVGSHNREASVRISNTESTAGNFQSIVFGTTARAGIEVKNINPESNYADVYFTSRGSDGWQTRMMISSSGYIGIGTTTPASRLHVDGEGRFEGSITGNLDLSVARNVTIEGDDQSTFGKNTLNVLAGYAAASSSATVKAITANAGGDIDTQTEIVLVNGIYARSRGVRTIGSNAIWNFAVYGEASGSEGDSANVGVFGTTLGTGTNIGVYGQGQGGVLNYGGYFEAVNSLNNNPVGAKNWAIWASGSMNIVGDLYVTGTIFGGQVASGSIGGTGTANKVAKFSAASTIADSSIEDDGSKVTVDSAILFKGGGTEVPTSQFGGIEFSVGRNTTDEVAHLGTARDIAFQWIGAGGGYRHWISTNHNSAANSVGNAIKFWLNDSATADGSSLPNTGSYLALSLHGDRTVRTSSSLTVGGSFTGSGNATFSTRIGIGTAADADHLLTFPQSTGNKIALYPVNTTTAYGFGIAGSQIRYYVPSTTTRHAFGRGDTDAFTEWMRITSGGLETGFNINAAGSITGSGGMSIAGTLTAGSITNLDELSGTIDRQRVVDGVNPSRSSRYYNEMFLDTDFYAGSNGGGNYARLPDEVGHPGLMTLYVVNSGSFSEFYFGGHFGKPQSVRLLAGGRRTFEALIRIPTGSNGLDMNATSYGLSEVASVFPTNGIEFRYDPDRYSAGSTEENWRFVTAATGSSVQVDTGITLTPNAWYLLKIEVAPATDAVTGSIYMTGSLVYQVSTKTYIPNLATGDPMCHFVGIRKSINFTSTRMHLDVDYVLDTQEFTSTRY